METNMQHSPLPWAIGPDGVFLDDAEGRTICVPNGFQRGNVALIVARVNAHDSLVELVREMKTALESVCEATEEFCNAGCTGENCPFFVARAVLTKVRDMEVGK